MEKDMKNTENKNGKARAAETATKPASEESVTLPQPPEAEDAPNPAQNLAMAIDEAAAKADLSVKDARRIKLLLEPVAKGEVDEQIVTMLAQALNRDEDLKNADTAGYVRGRNEKIDIVNRFDGGETETRPVNFPLYNKRGFWDDVK